MPIIISGKTLCMLCLRPVTRADVVAFPSFVANTMDPLVRFNDGVVHRKCLLSDDFGRQALDRYEVFRRYQQIKKVCCCCRSPIGSPDEWFGFGFLTADPGDPLYQYNGLEFHRDCLLRWDEVKQAYRDIDMSHRTGRWAGPTIDNLLKVLSDAVGSR